MYNMNRRPADRICGIIDLDGFHVEDEFLVREFGYISMKWKVGKSKRYDLSPYGHRLSKQDLKTIRYVKNNVTGLTFKPMLGELFYDLDDLDDHVVDFYESCKTSSRKVLAYKGGHVEQDLLDDLEIPSENLEIYGCPKFSELQCEKYDRINCGYHIEDLHCPRSEVTSFKDWLCDWLDGYD